MSIMPSLDQDLRMWVRLGAALIAGAAVLLFMARRSDASVSPVTGEGWVSALDSTRVQRSGTWFDSTFRYAWRTCLATDEEGAELAFTFTGTGVALGLAQQALPNNGGPSLGRLLVSIDNAAPVAVYPQGEALEVVLARDLEPGKHRVRVTHGSNGEGSGCRISGFRVLDERSGDLAFALNGDENRFLADARVVVRQEEREVRNVLVRNWLTGACRLTGLPVGNGYSLEVVAYGWEPLRIEGITIDPGREIRLAPVYLRRHPDTMPAGVRYPVVGAPAIRKPGEAFRVRAVAYETGIRQVKLSRRAGPAEISRVLDFEERPEAGYYYDKEGVAAIPPDTPPGLYDLSVVCAGPEREFVRRSPRSVFVVRDYPRDPVLVAFGHLDTQGQYQAEYERRVAEVANIIAPDMVLISNAVNPAYIAGAHLALEVPYVINFGNHRLEGHDRWYGNQVGIVDYGPDLCILNFGHPWHVGTAHAAGPA